MNEGLNFETFCRQFNSDSACAEALFKVRWPDGFRCPVCQHPHYYLIRTRRLPLYQCRSCRRQTSVIAGTVMEGSSTPLTRWFQAMYLMSQPAGISSFRLSQIIEVTYKTAWHISHKIRHAIHHADKSEPLMGVVRIDRVEYGSANYADARQPLIIGGSLDRKRNPLHVKIKQPDPNHVNNGPRRFIYPSGVKSFVKEHVAKEARKVYMRDSGVRNSALCKIRWDMNMWLNHTFQGIGAKHLQSYLDEFCFRLNMKQRPGAVFNKLIAWCAASPALVYDNLIRSKPVLSVPWRVFGSKAKWKGRHLSSWSRFG